jgi:hypothetical protein
VDGRFEVWDLIKSTLEPEISLCGPVSMAAVTSDENLILNNMKRHVQNHNGNVSDRERSFAAHFETVATVSPPLAPPVAFRLRAVFSLCACAAHCRWRSPDHPPARTAPPLPPPSPLSRYAQASLPIAAEEHAPEPFALTTLLFSKLRPDIVVAGDSWGAVDVMVIGGLGAPAADAEAQLRAALFREER